MNVMDKGLNQILKEEQESYLKWKKENEVVQIHLRTKGLKDVKKKRKAYGNSLRQEELSVIKEGLVSMIQRGRTQRLSPQSTTSVGGPAKRSLKNTAKSTADVGRVVDSQALVRKLSAKIALIFTDQK